MGIVPEEFSKPMAKEMTQSLLAIVELEMQDSSFKTAKEILGEMTSRSESTEDMEALFPFQAIEKRIDVYGFNMKFTIPAFLSFGVFPDRVGALVVMLIDILETLGEENITLNDIIENLYPWGFYNEKGLVQRIDELKADKELPEEQRKYKYSFVY
jgi:hypothetical protein